MADIWPVLSEILKAYVPNKFMKYLSGNRIEVKLLI